MTGYALLFSTKDGRGPRLLRVPGPGMAAFRYDLERTLHDRVAVGVSAMAAQLDLVSVASKDAALDAKIDAVRETLCQVVDDVREVGRSIYPPVLGGACLGSALVAVADHRNLRLRLDLPSHELSADIRARVGLLVSDHLNSLPPDTVVQVRVRGRSVVRVLITENPHRGVLRRRPLLAALLYG
ncbi:histidine kinase [Thermocrispum municipale]|uniref:histidine kinase n=1 Tax=Thermocrispum municipale TaxID=37926 RepID=UPI0004903030|nr:histidine kinase [Thermocrispum municipale]